MVKDACATLAVPPERCVVVGDIGTDAEAAAAAGARSVLVPTEVTREREVSAAPVVAGSLPEAVDLVLTGRWAP
jgi:beta-phosphoglucomutase-like phosphatase (HAD superfamily)